MYKLITGNRESINFEKFILLLCDGMQEDIHYTIQLIDK